MPMELRVKLEVLEVVVGITTPAPAVLAQPGKEIMVVMALPLQIMAAVAVAVRVQSAKTAQGLEVAMVAMALPM
jgi:spore maturation protein SpmB